MAQSAKPIDLSRSFQPTDPNTLPETMSETGSEDAPEKMPPVIPFEGYNFMPTAYGYRSYFGLTAALEGDPMLNYPTCREIFNFQKSDLSNILVALCDEGIYTRSGDVSESWVQDIALTPPDAGVLLEWSHCIIENVLYVYRQGEAHVWTFESPDYVWTANTPTTLNMAGQLGIFKAGGRLGFWDSDDSVGWSAFDDHFDVTPSAATLANITKFTDVIGKIINIVQHDQGFIIYATKSVVGVKRNLDNTFLWDAKAISTKAGISYRHQVAIAEPDAMHFAWTSIGFMKISMYQQELVGAEIYDYLKEQQLPVYLKFLEGRYLFIQLADEKYVDGIISFYTQTLDADSFTLSKVAETVADLPDRLIETTIPTSILNKNLFKSYNIYPDHAVAVEDKGSCANPRRRCVGINYGDYKNFFWPPSNPGTTLTALAGDITTVAWNKLPFSINGKTYYLGSTEDPLVVIATPNPASKAFDGTGFVEDTEGDFLSRSVALARAHENYIAAWKNKLETQLPFKFGESGLPIETNVNQAQSNTLYTMPIGLNGSNEIMALTGVFKSPQETPLNDSGSNDVAFAVVDKFWYDMGRNGELFYFLAWSRGYTTYTIRCMSEASDIKYPVSVNISNLAGGLTLANINTAINNFSSSLPLVDLVTAKISCADVTELAGILTVFNTFHTYLVGASTTLTASGVPSYDYVNLTGIQSSVSAANLVGVYNGSQTIVPSSIGSAMTVHINGSTGQECKLTLVSPGLTSYDKVRAQKAIQTVPQCSAYKYFHYSYPYQYLNYDASGNSVVSPTAVPPLTFAAIRALIEANNSCIIPVPTGNPSDVDNPANLMGLTMYEDASTFLVDFSYTIEGFTFTYPGSELIFTYPGTSFLMQRGTAAPVDIVWKGAYVYDTAYKKWGKFKGDYRQLLDFSPVNSTALGIVPHTNFGMQSAILADDGNIMLFDMHPTDSFIKFGKIGLFRQGFTDLEQIRADFRQHCTGRLTLETSIDGQSVEGGLTDVVDYTNVTQVFQGFTNSGRWHNIMFSDQYDLVYLEYRAWQKSRR